jgi:flagellar motor switch/type III secretory pathway protein FliN
MSESEETKPVQENKSSSATSGVTPSLEVPAPLSEVKPTEEEAQKKEPSQEASPETAAPKKVELKKHSLPAPPAVPVTPAPTSASVEESVVINPRKETAANALQVGLEVEVDFILDRKRISLTALNVLAEGEVLTLSGADFKATLFLQEKAIAEAELVMVDQRPSIQITKVFSAS